MVISRTGDPWSPHVEQLDDETVPEGAAVDGDGISPEVTPDPTPDPIPDPTSETEAPNDDDAETKTPETPDAPVSPEPSGPANDTPDELAAALAELEAARTK